MESSLVRILALCGIFTVAAILALAFGRWIADGLDAAFSKLRRLGFLGRIITAAMVVVATVEAQKGGVKKSKSQVEVEQRTSSNSTVQLGLPTSTHFLTSVKTNVSYSYEMPTNAVRYSSWWMRGGYEDVFSLSFGDWSFPIGTASVSSLWVYTWGKVRTKLRGGYEIAEIGAPMSAVPQFSQFWHSDGTNGSKILTWHNFFLGRVPIAQASSNSVYSVFSVVPISAQLELFPNGDYIARSNLVERAYKRVNPDDWDDDGIPNDIDDEPLVGNGENFGPSDDLPDGANADNYCWVEVTVSGANSLVTFQGDKPSNLPDPRFVARAGEAYRVNLLIGKTYRVSSAQPIECTAKSNDAISVDKTSASTMHVVYPVSYEIVDAMRSVSRQVRMVPPLVGSIQWDTNSCLCHAKTDADSFNLPMCYGACSCYSCDPGGFTFNYEGYSLSFGGVECDCAPHIPEEEDDGPYAASASVSFSKSAVIFEDEYMNTPTETVPRRSTSTTLTCTAHGGPNGGRAIFTLANAEKLIRKSGVDLPIEIDVAAGHKVSFNIVYEGVEASGAEGDIVATAQFVDNKNGELELVVDRITIIKIYLYTAVEAFGNRSRERHEYGVAEWVNYRHYPVDAKVEWMVYNGFVLLSDKKILECPLNVTQGGINVSFNDVVYEPIISVCEPSGIVCSGAIMVDCNTAKGVAGHFGMTLYDLFLTPRTVSFGRLYIEEIPSDNGSRFGYFLSSFFDNKSSHGYSAGAGIWRSVLPDNTIFTVDNVTFGSAPPPWNEGGMVWPIPMGWHTNNVPLGTPPIKEIPCSVSAVYTIMGSGKGIVSKLGHWVSRDTNDVIVVDGEIMKGIE